jgi:Rrf2 family transcriptional regulator, nitric oxide-sensitive transcriptional repressor
MHLLDCVGTPGFCVIQPGCKLRGVLAEAERLQMEYLMAVKLSDVVAPGGQLLEITGPPPSQPKTAREAAGKNTVLS